MTCPHTDTVPVEITIKDLIPSAAPVVVTVGRLCIDCLVELPVAWGCRDCSWIQVSNTWAMIPKRLLRRACPEHAIDPWAAADHLTRTGGTL